MNYLIRLIVLSFLLLPIAAAGNEEKVKIAVIFGDAAYTSSGIQEGLLAARLSVEELNRQGGILGKQVELIELDNKTTPLGSRFAAQKAVQTDVAAVLGPFSSSHALLAAAVLQESGIPMILSMSTNGEVTKIGDYIFRVCYTDPFQGEALAKFALDELKAKTAVVLNCTGEIYSIELAKIFIDRFTEKGGNILWQGRYLSEATDFKDLLEKIKTLRPDVVFLPGYDSSSGFIIKQARNMGISVTFFGGDAWSEKMYQYGGEAIEDSYYSSHWDIGSKSKISQEFVKQYINDYKKEEIIPFGLVRDALFLLAEAVKRADSRDRSLIRRELAATKNFHGVTGDITMDENGDPLKPIVIFRFENGTSVSVKTINPSNSTE